MHIKAVITALEAWAPAPGPLYNNKHTLERELIRPDIGDHITRDSALAHVSFLRSCVRA